MVVSIGRKNKIRLSLWEGEGKGDQLEMDEIEMKLHVLDLKNDNHAKAIRKKKITILSSRQDYVLYTI
jgi:hypothetical protein